MRTSQGRTGHFLSKGALVIVSLLLPLGAFEVGLRVFYPKYEYAADAKYERSMSRIWVRTKNTHYTREHPDTGKSHPVYHNNLSLRQHRDVKPKAIKEATNIGFFGDSFLENLRLPAQQTFVEFLDYLLNESGSPFNVLNFGVDGYGTGQSFLSYRDFEFSDELDHIYYLFCVNDLRNIYENDLFELDESGQLIQTQAQPTSLWKKTVGRFHLTYLIIGTFQKRAQATRFQDEAGVLLENAAFKGKQTAELASVVAIFKALLFEWKQTAENQGAQFHVVLLPRLQEYQSRHFIPPEIDTVDLFKLFYDNIEQYDYQDWHFENDGHWDEAANQMAATFLLRSLEEKLNLSPISDDELKRRTSTYYSSFDGWTPGDHYLLQASVDPQIKEAIKRRYAELELE
ncbi:hypothetical protein F7C95_02900 [Opitutia bacterium ISCC 51]|nr:hypothetical protein F7C95_02900 [Opitutae bacterium ISCC 51]QXD28941.1 hypothetical protein GA003_02880 [Opitutae bacterium ISCC 52]